MSFFEQNKDEGGTPLEHTSEFDKESSFAARLITGLAAEQYFQLKHTVIPEFRNYQIENTTRLGCGYEFRLWNASRDESFLAVEVKGLKGQSGSILMTTKENAVAAELSHRFYLFVVRNFQQSPRHDLYHNSLSGLLAFKKIERVVIQTSWLAKV